MNQDLSTLLDDVGDLSARLHRLLDGMPSLDSDHGRLLDEAADHLDRCGSRLDEALGATPADRPWAAHVLHAITLWPEWIPAIPLLDQRDLWMRWWNPRLQGRLVALHAGRRWGGSGARTAKPAAIDAVCARARASDADPADLRAYERAACGLTEGWDVDPCGRVRVVVEITAAVRCGETVGVLAPRLPLWRWLLGKVHVLPTSIPVRRSGHRRGLWQLPRSTAREVFEALCADMAKGAA